MSAAPGSAAANENAADDLSTRVTEGGICQVNEIVEETQSGGRRLPARRHPKRAISEEVRLIRVAHGSSSRREGG